MTFDVQVVLAEPYAVHAPRKVPLMGPPREGSSNVCAISAFSGEISTMWCFAAATPSVATPSPARSSTRFPGVKAPPVSCGTYEGVPVDERVEERVEVALAVRDTDAVLEAVVEEVGVLGGVPEGLMSGSNEGDAVGDTEPVGELEGVTLEVRDGVGGGAMGAICSVNEGGER